METITIEEMKELLKSLLDYDSTINVLTDELDYWKSKKTIDVSEHIQYLENKIKCLTDTKIKVSKTINKLSDPIARAIFTKRYILCNTWKKAAASCGKMSERNAHYIQDQTLPEFIKIWTTN